MLMIVAGIILGAFGQGIRTGLGIVKDYRANPTPFTVDYTLLTLNLVVGAVAGVLTVLMLAGNDGMTRALAMAAIAAGYAGPDAIESMLNAARRVAVWLIIAGGLVALMLLAPSARASSPSAPASCFSVTAETAEAAMIDPGAALAIYRDRDAARFVAAATALFGVPPPFDAAGVTFVVTYQPTDPRIPAQVHFYAGAGNCRIFVATWDPRTIAGIVRLMAEMAAKGTI